VVNASRYSGHSGYWKDTAQNLTNLAFALINDLKSHLRLHWHKVWHHQSGAIDEADVWSPEESLEMFCLLTRVVELGIQDKFVHTTFPGVLEARTLIEPKSAFNSDDLPTFG
jgi:hypothetical protein